MARYIDANKLNKDILASWDKDTHRTIKASLVHRQEHQHLMDIILKQPTADVEEVKRGEWIYHECVSSYDGAISGYSCSACCSFVDDEIFESGVFHKNYCGNCGAKMDETKKGK